MIAVICDNDSIHHARKVTAYLEEHPRLELLYGARYSPQKAERIWAALTNYLANTADTWPALGRSTPASATLTRPDAGHRRAPDQPLAIARLEAELPECRLVGAVLVEIHDEWQVGERRYLSEGSMALLIKPPASSEGLATPALLKA